MRSLTTRQAEVLRFISRELRTKSRCPSLGEIGAHFRIAAPSVADHLDAIEAKGYIQRVNGERRNIRILQLAPSPDLGGLPVLGRIAAGVPLLAQQNMDRRVDIPSTLFSPRADFLLEVQGDSMVDAGLRPGDLVGIHAQQSAETGQVVAALLLQSATGEYEATLKRFRRRGARIILESENRQQGYAPIEVRLTEGDEDPPPFAVAGIYCGHLHRGRGGRP